MNDLSDNEAERLRQWSISIQAQQQMYEALTDRHMNIPCTFIGTRTGPVVKTLSLWRATLLTLCIGFIIITMFVTYISLSHTSATSTYLLTMFSFSTLMYMIMVVMRRIRFSWK